MKRLLCVDPGGTTGWAIFDYSDTEPLTLRDCGQIERGLTGFLDWWEGREVHFCDVVVAEDFVLDQRTVSPELVPLRILGALAVLHPGFIAQRNVMMKHAPDSALRRFGLYVNAQRHARDAIRHGLAWAKTTAHRPSIEKYWPDKRGA